MAGVGSFRLLAKLGEHLVETFDLDLRIYYVRLEASLQALAPAPPLRNGFSELLFRIVDVLQLMQEQIEHCFDVFGENSNRPCLHAGLKSSTTASSFLILARFTFMYGRRISKCG